MKNYFLLSILAFISFHFTAFADSPLTSTHFSTAYKNVPIVLQASESNGELKPKLMEFLSDENQAIDLKMAVINMLGWNFAGKSNATAFLNHLKKKNGYADKKDFLKNGNKADLLCMAYLKALDNYFKVDEAIEYADAALENNPKSYTFYIIAALIKAQKAFDNNWCDVFRITDHVRQNKNLKLDMKKAATEIIFGYMDLYKSSCE